MVPHRSLYLSHFGLSRPPFQITPHTDFFYPGGDRGHLLDAVIWAVQHNEGIVTVTGEVGTGKTMLARMVIEQVPSHVSIVYIANPAIGRDEILLTIAEELGLEVGEQRTSQMLRALQRHLIDLHARGQRVVVLVDEAHAMPIETLEEIRLLSNLETDSSKLIQILLFGQQELNETLAAPECRPIRERITQRFEVMPLGAGEIATYLTHRLEKAGGDRELFEPRAAAQIAKLSKGLTRRVNILADKCLLAAFADGSDRVRMPHVKLAIDDTAFRALRGMGTAMADRNWRTVAFASAGGVLVGAAAVLVPVLARAAF
jgi:MSHA biogenesis protein MshM